MASCEQNIYKKHIKEINKCAPLLASNDSIWIKIKKITIHLAQNLSIIGAVNLLVFLLLTFLTQIYMSEKTSVFNEFKWWHHLLWMGILLSQVIYILYLLLYPPVVDGLMDGALYDLFTTRIIDNGIQWGRLFTIIKNICKAIIVEPATEYILLSLLVIIPWPFFKNIAIPKRLGILFTKIGIFNVIISLICMNYKNEENQFTIDYVMIPPVSSPPCK